MHTHFKIALLVLMFILMLASVPLLFAQDTVTVNPNAPVNVRTGPGTEYSVRGVLFDSAPAVGRNDFSINRVCRGVENDMWLKVDFKGFEGWVNRCVVALDGDMSDLPVSEASAPITVKEIYTKEYPVVRTNRGDLIPDTPYVIGFSRSRINVRATPSLEASIQAVTAPIEDLYVTGRTEDNKWLEITYDGETGWVAAYLMLMPRDWEVNVPVK